LVHLFSEFLEFTVPKQLAESSNLNKNNDYGSDYGDDDYGDMDNYGDED